MKVLDTIVYGFYLLLCSKDSGESWLFLNLKDQLRIEIVGCRFRLNFLLLNANGSIGEIIYRSPSPIYWLRNLKRYAIYISIIIYFLLPWSFLFREICPLKHCSNWAEYCSFHQSVTDSLTQGVLIYRCNLLYGAFILLAASPKQCLLVRLVM